MNSRTKRNERVITRICAVISACMLIGLSSGAAFAAPLESAGSPSTAPAAPQGIKTLAVKKAVKVVIKALRSAAAADAAAMLTKEGAKASVRQMAVRHAGAIATRLEALLAVEDLTLNFIENQVINALMHAGVRDGMCREVGLMVKMIVWAAL